MGIQLAFEPDDVIKAINRRTFVTLDNLTRDYGFSGDDVAQTMLLQKTIDHLIRIGKVVAVDYQGLPVSHNEVGYRTTE